MGYGINTHALVASFTMYDGLCKWLLAEVVPAKLPLPRLLVLGINELVVLVRRMLGGRGWTAPEVGRIRNTGECRDVGWPDLLAV